MEIRLDRLVMEKTGFSREYAQSIIKDGGLSVDGKVVIKPGTKLDSNTEININIAVEPMKYVSRGGYKLEKALEEFNISLEGLVCGDIGASTGGFTDCMLQNDAEKIYAVDVGTGQLADKLKNNPLVISMENINIKKLRELPEKLDFIAIDVSFISITKIIENTVSLLSDNGSIVCLIKPQFEAGRQNLKKGIVKDKKLYIKILSDIRNYFESVGLSITEVIESPIKGKDGNTEFLAFCSRAFVKPL